MEARKEEIQINLLIAIMTKTKVTNFPKVAQGSFSIELLD